ncbi:hypothetical protein [Nocardia altamirensis]|uniref:hypothetical protein n=1 Tax=Nocardia altamirensis TaxID=472158 RepID=UPI0008408E69|nr:hypothetical protein [Nocardia altamirensis]
MPRPPATGHLRGGLVGVLVGSLAVAAHGSAGGGFAGSAELTVVLLLAGAAGCAANVLAAGRGSTLLWLGLGQLACHLALTGLLGHDHPAPETALLPTGWMLIAHAVAILGAALLISVAERLYAVASSAVRAVLTEVRPARVLEPAGWANPGLPHYFFAPNGAIGPRAPPRQA